MVESWLERRPYRPQTLTLHTDGGVELKSDGDNNGISLVITCSVSASTHFEPFGSVSVASAPVLCKTGLDDKREPCELPAGWFARIPIGS